MLRVTALNDSSGLLYWTLLFNQFSGKLPQCSLYQGIVNNWFKKPSISGSEMTKNYSTRNSRTGRQNCLKLSCTHKCYPCWSVWHSCFITCWHLFVILRYILYLCLWIVFVVTRISLNLGSVPLNCPPWHTTDHVVTRCQCIQLTPKWQRLYYFFYVYVYLPSIHQLQLKTLLNSEDAIEASRAN